GGHGQGERCRCRGKWPEDFPHEFGSQTIIAPSGTSLTARSARLCDAGKSMRGFDFAQCTTARFRAAAPRAAHFSNTGASGVPSARAVPPAIRPSRRVETPGLDKHEIYRTRPPDRPDGIKLSSSIDSVYG